MKKITLIAVCLSLLFCGCATVEQKTAKAEAKFQRIVPAPKYNCEKQDIPKEEVDVRKIEEYETSNACIYFNASGYYAVQKLNDYEILAYPCNAFGCDRRQLAHISLPQRLGAISQGSIIKITERHCGVRAGYYNYETTAGFMNRVPSIEYSLKRKYSERERKAMIAEKQKIMDGIYQKKLKASEEAFKRCEAAYNRQLFDWLHSTNVEEYKKKYPKYIQEETVLNWGATLY